MPSLFGTLTLGELIALIEKRKRTDEVRFDFGYTAPCGIGSYRGWYNHLALDWKDGHLLNAGMFLDMLKSADGKVYEGYKGGEYLMGRETPIWVSNYSEASSTGIVGLAECDYQVVIATAYMPK